MVMFKHEHAREIIYHPGIGDIKNRNEALQLFQNQNGRSCDVQT